MSEKEYRDRLAEAENELNRRGSEGRLRKRTDLAPFEGKVVADWHGKVESDSDKENPSESNLESGNKDISMHKKRIGFLIPFFIFCLLFFVVASGVAYLRFSGNDNLVSNDNVVISVSGPLSVRAGEDLTLEVMIENKNTVPLQYVDLVATFPDGTRMPGALSESLPRIRETLGEIPANSFRKETVKAVLFGEEDAESKIVFTIEYRVPGSNAIFHKDKETGVLLSDAPLRMVVNASETVVSGDEIKLSVTVTSNTGNTLRDVYLVAGYPPGFSYDSASQNPIVGAKMWALGDIAPGATRTLDIMGVLDGEEDETKIFRVTAGVGRSGEGSGITLPYAEVSSRMKLTHPELGLGMTVNGSGASPMVVAGDKDVVVELSWVNNLPEKILDATIQVSLTGALLDKRSVVVEKGFYDSGNSTITITKADLEDLASINEGGKGTVSFSFKMLSPESTVSSLGKNSTVLLSATATGRRAGDGSETKSATNKVSREIRVPSALSLSAQALYSSGPFANKGSLPPKVGSETTYTIVWTLSNAGNDLRDVTVRTVLPPYIRFVGTISPSDEGLLYKENGRTVIWSVDRLLANTGYGSSAKTVAFQVAFTPSLTQVGESPIILGESTASGRDLFVGTDVLSARRELSTELTTDPTYTTGKGTVTE